MTIYVGYWRKKDMSTCFFYCLIHSFPPALLLCYRESGLWHHVSGLWLHLPPAEPQEAGHVQWHQPLSLPGKTKSLFIVCWKQNLERISLHKDRQIVLKIPDCRKFAGFLLCWSKINFSSNHVIHYIIYSLWHNNKPLPCRTQLMTLIQT